MSDLRQIFDRTDGRCHLCGKRLCFANYGKGGSRGAWEREHSVPRALGGSDHGNNLYPACVSCNRAKGAKLTRAVRRKNGRTRAPLSKNARSRAQGERIGELAVGLGAVGFAVAGPAGAVVGAIVGAAAGRDWKVTD